MKRPEPKSHDRDQGNEAKKAAWAQARERFKEVRTWLENTYPKAFNFKSPIPLKRGIKKDVLTIESDFNKFELINALNAYVKNYKYLKSIIKGEWRVDLNGNQVEKICESSKVYSADKIKIIIKRKKEQKHKASRNTRDLIATTDPN